MATTCSELCNSEASRRIYHEARFLHRSENTSHDKRWSVVIQLRWLASVDLQSKAFLARGLDQDPETGVAELLQVNAPGMLALAVLLLTFNDKIPKTKDPRFSPITLSVECICSAKRSIIKLARGPRVS